MDIDVAGAKPQAHEFAGSERHDAAAWWPSANTTHFDSTTGCRGRSGDATFENATA